VSDDTQLSTDRLPRLIERAATALAKATTAAEILDARDAATLVYDAAKAAARFAKAKGAHDEVVASVRKVQADALIIEAAAMCRLADEYDAAQARGEVASHSAGNPQIVPDRNDLPPTAAELGISRKQVYQARVIRDAEKKKPGIVKNTVDERLRAGQEPTRAHVRRAADEALHPEEQQPAAKQPRQASAPEATQATKPSAPDTGTKSSSSDAPTVAMLQARVRELQQQLAERDRMIADLQKQLARHPTKVSADRIEKLETENFGLKYNLERLQEAERKRLAGDPSASERALQGEIASLRGQLAHAKAEAKPRDRDVEMEKLRARLRAKFRLGPKMIKSIQFFLHPDRYQTDVEKGHAERAFKWFDSLGIKPGPE
jgi:hypothetical protein